MTRKRKILYSLSLITLLSILVLAGSLLYLYHHPQKIKSLVVKAVSSSTGMVCGIDKLTYSLSPMTVVAKGVSLNSSDPVMGLELHIPSLRADLALDGPFSQRTLVIKMLKVKGPSMAFSEKIVMPMLMPGTSEPSVLKEFLIGLFGLLMFRDIQFRGGAISHGSLDADLQDLKIRAKEVEALFSKEQPLTATCRLDISWPSMQIRRLASELSIRTPSFKKTPNRYHIKAHNTSLAAAGAELRRAEMEIALLYDADTKRITLDPFDLRVEGIHMESRVGETLHQRKAIEIQSADLKGKLFYDMGQGHCMFEPVDLHLEAIRLSNRKREIVLPTNLQLNLRGAIDVPNSRLILSHLKMRIDDIMDLAGRLEAVQSPEPEVTFEIQEASLLLEKLLDFIPENLIGPRQSFRMEGPASMRGIVKGVQTSDGWEWGGDLRTVLDENPLSYSNGVIHVSGAVKGDIRSEGFFPQIKVMTGLELKDGLFSGWNMERVPFEAALSAKAMAPKLHIQSFKARIPRFRFPLKGKEIPLDQLFIHLKGGRFNGDKRSILLPEVRIDSDLFTNVMLSLDMAPKRTIIHVKAEDSRLLGVMSQIKLLPSGWQYQGKESIRIRASEKQDHWDISSQMALREFSFQNEDESAMGESISLEAQIEGSLSEKMNSCDFKSSIRIDNGEVLYDRFYMNLLKHPCIAHGEGDMGFNGKALTLSDFTLDLQDILALHVAGRVEFGGQNRHTQFFVNLPPTSFGPIFRQFVLDPFKTENPFLSSIQLGGDLSAELEMSGKPNHWVIKGLSRWHHGTFSSGPNGVEVTGLRLNLPLWYQSQKTENEPKRLEGRLSIDSLTVPFLPEQSLDLSISAAPNRIHTSTPIKISLYGGDIILGPTSARNIYGRQFSLETSLALKSIQLDPVLSQIWPHRVHGSVEGRLDPVTFEDGLVKTEGDITAKLFDGEIVLSQLSAIGLMTGSPLFRMNVSLNDLNLSEMTKDTSFGKIQGLLRGDIKGLAVAYGQPQSFQLLLETVKKSGVSQKISVAAVDNIARIGGGTSPFIGLAGGFASLFREFPYEKIGVRASLENDVFRINGTIREGDLEYLIKRGGFSGVNVVNQNPDNRIRFKDMVKRIKRIRDSKTGPVIK
jgi:hypothetical protein